MEKELFVVPPLDTLWIRRNNLWQKEPIIVSMQKVENIEHLPFSHVEIVYSPATKFLITPSV